MKHIILILILFSCMNALQAQIPQNRSCYSAKKICDVGEEIYVLNGNIQYCTQPLYYSFLQAITSNNAVYFNAYGSGGTINLYSSPDSVCSDITLGVATLVSTTTFGPHDNVTMPFNGMGYFILEVTLDTCAFNDTLYEVPVQGIMYNIELNNFSHVYCSGQVIPEPEAPAEEPEEEPCKTCISSFSPPPGYYMVSAWVREPDASMNTITYANASIGVTFTSDPMSYNLIPTGRIIDGWQQIQQMIEIPAPATEIHLALKSGGVDAYFDDIRFYPLDGSMISYVYDPTNLRLMAQLDERNFATFYEYDEEGKLIRVKKETERGVMTIQENRDNIRKQ